MAAFQKSFAFALAQGADPDERVLDGALARALAVHRNTAAAAARDALLANFPVIRALFGDDAFNACAGAYVRGHPPRAPCLNTYGESFIGFLAEYGPARALTYLPDVARLERLCIESLFAEDAEPIDPARLARALSAGSSPRLHPATRFERFEHPAASLWLAHQSGDHAAFEAIEWVPEDVLVTRPAHDVRVAVAEPGALAFLRACAAGADLKASALAAGAAGADVSTLLPILVQAGAFA
jgi:hypothetical protein